MSLWDPVYHLQKVGNCLLGFPFRPNFSSMDTRFRIASADQPCTVSLGAITPFASTGQHPNSLVNVADLLKLEGRHGDGSSERGAQDIGGR